jgi:hypothetical protein
MKFKHISVQNCQYLLPGFFDIRILRGFDNYLQELDEYAPHRGVVGKLVQKNQSTNMQKPWGRLLDYDIDVCLVMKFQTMQPQWSIQDHYACPEGARTGFNRRVEAMFSLVYGDGTRWTFKMPIQYLLKGWGDANEGHQFYVHCIKLSGTTDMFGDVAPKGSKPIERCYSGITKRNWLKRLEEHLREVRQGGHKLFHQAWRQSTEGKDVIYTSQLQMVNLTKDEVMKWEEGYVDTHTLSPKGLNMIPGGYEGNKHLYKHKLIDRLDIDLDERERAITEYARRHPRKGMPNPFLSELWQDDEYYLRVIGSRKKTLTPDQVREIRTLHNAGYSIAEITKKVEAINERQVENVLAERTYVRIH